MKDLINYIEEQLSKLKDRPNILFVDKEEMNDFTTSFGQPTICDNYNFTSNVKTLSTAQTVYLMTNDNHSHKYTQKKKDIYDSAKPTLLKVFEYLGKCPLIHSQSRMCDNDSFTVACDFYLSAYKKDTAHLSVMFNAMSFPINGKETDNLKVICIPEWSEKDRQVIVVPEIGTTFILGSDYYGEIKNAFLRMSIYNAKKRDILGMHAATKVINVKTKENTIRKVGVVIFGISATGKTTHILHDHGFKQEGESVEILQDDLVFFRQDGSILGSENGFYIKTDSLSQSNQPLLYNAAKMPGALLENVMVDYQGNVYFEDKVITTNSHAIISRDILKEHIGNSINMPTFDELDDLIFIFMAKNFTVVPVVSKLSARQASVAYMLSEPFDAIGSELGKLDGKGGLISMPLSVGNDVEDVNSFYDILNKYSDKIECYMLNSGGVGEWVEAGLDGARKIRKKVTRISIPEISLAIKSIVKKEVNWIDDQNWMVKIPENIEGMNINKYNLYNYYDQEKIDSLIATVRNERRAFANNYVGLNQNIVDSCEF